jgi:mannose-6-phosphate isomerase
MSSLTLLRFEPVFRRYIWGGRRLATTLNKPIGDGNDYAESWEIVDHGEDQSVVAAGPHKGRKLGELVRTQGRELFGRHPPQPRFPLLFKFLDCQKKLSVQVHPDDATAARLDPPDLGKTEAWVILEARPGSVIYAGLKRGFDRAALAREVARGTTELCLHRFEPRAGDCVFLPAGVVHALGDGLLVAEIQQSSDTTYRLFDWNRVGADGKPRQLHVDEALSAIDYDHGPVEPRVPQPTDRPHVSRLVACEKFILDRWRFSEQATVGGDGRFHILAVLQGRVRVAGDPSEQPLARGQTMLLPASVDAVEIAPAEATELLDMYLP